MYNSKPSSVSHKDGGDNSLIPAWSFLSLPWLLRLDLAHNLMTSSLHSALWKAAHAIAGPEGLSGRPLSHWPMSGLRFRSDLLSSWRGCILHPQQTKPLGQSDFFFPTSQVACSLHLLYGRPILHHSFAMKYTSWSNYVHWSFLYKGSKFSNLAAQFF